MLLELFSKIILGIFFYPKPNFIFSKEEIIEYEEVLEEAEDGLIQYNRIYPKYRFLEYLAINKDFIMHGTNNPNIKTFEIRRQTLFNGKYVDAVFGSKDSIWPVFYAILDKSKVNGSIRNGCVETKKGKKFYFFSLNKDNIVQDPWTSGMIYFLPKEHFYKIDKGIVQFDEWISNIPTKPIARVAVNPTDFYYLNDISRHKENESIITTWIKYKWRIRRIRREFKE